MKQKIVFTAEPGKLRGDKMRDRSIVCLIVRAYRGDLPQVLGTTLSKTEEHPPEEKQTKTKEIRHAPNMPWAPSGPGRISCLRQHLAPGPRKEEFFRQGVSAVACWCFTDSGAEWECFRCQNGPNRYPKQSKYNRRGAKMSQGIFKDTLAEQGRESIQKGYQKGGRGDGFCVSVLDPNQYKKNNTKESFKNQSRKNMNNAAKTMPKGSQNS